MRKIGFFGIFGSSRYTYAGAIHHCDAMPRSSGSRIDNALELYWETGNKGNMIHGEAPTRIFEMNREKSCYVSAKSLIVDLDWTPEHVGKELSEKFDLVVFSTANMIRTDFDPGATAAILDSLTVDFVVLGMGMQNSLPPTTKSFHPNLISLLEVCDKKAIVFGVRGLATETWLRSVGLDNARALGCPSLYVYPQNILNIAAPDPNMIRAALTGGYISARIPRATTVISLFKDINSHYVMQDELDVLRDLDELVDPKYIYNDATGELNKEVLERILEKIHYTIMPFASYRWFQDPNAWRVFASQCDVYIGDRLHGGIVALQTGVPSILIYEDQRVSEVANYFGIPTISVGNMRGMNLRDVIAEHLTAENIQYFKDTYFERFLGFQETFKKLDISLTVSASAPQNSLSISKKPRSRIRARGAILRHLLKKITH